MRLRVACAALVALPTLAAAGLGAQAHLARRGPRPEPIDLDLDGRFGPAAGDPLRTVWLGDSTAASIGATERSSAVSSRVAARLGAIRGRPVEVHNLARSGATTDDVLVEQVPSLADVAAVDIVFVSVGANDTLQFVGRSRFAANYRLVSAALPPGATVVMLGVPDIGSVPRLGRPLRDIVGWRGDVMNSVVGQLAAELGHTYVDIAAHTRAVGAASGIGALVRPDEPTDQFHPTDTGYGVWADAIIEVVEAEDIGT